MNIENVKAQTAGHFESDLDAADRSAGTGQKLSALSRCVCGNCLNKFVS